MPRHDFSALFARYPDVIGQMPAVFTSHTFILRLAQQNQELYIDALFSYRNTAAPFMTVHGILAGHLHAYPEQVQHLGEMPSTNIFGQPNECAQWRRL